LSEAVYIDREMWEKIVLNLLSNAFKFTFAGEIEVSLNETDNAVELRVRDTGVGIPESELGRIFERFYRSKESQGRTYEGTGIGLALVQELARLHGGTVTVASISGEGSIFTITIPKGSAHLPKDHVQNARSLDAPSRRIQPFLEEADRWLPGADGGQWSVVGGQFEDIKTDHRPPITDHCPRILLADDNADMREYVERLLRPYFEVEAVADGVAALDAARRQPPDLVLSDVMMPRLDGFGLLKVLRDDEATRTIPILLLSARAGEESKIEGLDAGADDYLIKPFSARELLARVRLHLKMAQIRRDAAESIRESEERFRKAFSASPHLVTISTLDEGRYLAVNDAVLKKTGFSREEMVGHTAAELNIYPGNNGRDRLVEALRHAPVRDLEITVRAKSGEKQLLSLSADIVPFDGKPCIITAALDITERKKAEEKVRASEAQLQTLFDKMPMGAYLIDADFRLRAVNPLALPAFGEIPILIGRDFAEVIHILWTKDYADEIVRLFRHTLETGEPYYTPERIEHRLDRNATEYYEWQINRIPLPDSRYGVVCYFRDISAQVFARQAITESEERYRAFVTQSSEAIWRFEIQQPVDITLPADTQIERFYQYAYLAECNDRMAQMYGFTKAVEIIGARLHELLPPTDTANLDYLRAFITSGYRLTEAESHEVDRDGRQRYFLNNLVGIIADQHLIRAWGTQRDITDRKLAEQQREELLHKEQQARAMAEEANRLKDDFLATVSHELRTPLNAMLGWAKMASQSSDLLLMQQALEVITRNARSQNQIISDILDVSRIVTGKLNLSMAKIDLIPVIEAAIETIRPAATAKMIQLQTRFDPSWRRVFGDANRLQQIIWNLLSNAVKFTPENGRIIIQLQRHDQQLELAVSDSGEGIDPEFLPFVFDRFRQGESGASRKHGGLGLGLAIVRHLVELHGGTVKVESQGKGYGTTFRISLPLLAVTGERHGINDDSATENGQREPFSPVLAGRHILVVDDDEDGRSLLDFLLAQSGATVSLAASVADALQQIEGSLPDVVISDIGMSEQDGYDFIRALRVRHQHLPAIALTAYARQEDRLRALQEGFTQYLSKPLEPEELIAVVAELTGKS
jgi:PAS domain S-box-containing protein